MDLCAEYQGNGNVSKESLKAASEDELIDLKIEVDDDIIRITDQINAAKAEHIESGSYANADWYRRATTAKKIKGHLSQRIQIELARKKEERKKKDHERRDIDRAGYLLEAMKQVLTPEQYEKVIGVRKELQQ